MPLITPKLIAVGILMTLATAATAQAMRCFVASGATITPVVELYTSEGCSSCPPADKWASSLKGLASSGGAVVQAFHVGYWDHIGWTDRFAAPAYTQRQRDVAARNNLRSIYTPQAVLNGKDWPRWGGPLDAIAPAKANITLKQLGADQFEASVTAVTPAALVTATAPITPITSVTSANPAASWTAYWTVTEHDHNSKVLSGENKGEFLKHDFVVRQLVQAGTYPSSGFGVQKLKFNSIASTPGHARQINLVVSDVKSGMPMQAVSLQCAS